MNMTQRIYGIRATEEDIEALNRVLQGLRVDKTTWLRQVIHTYDQVLQEGSTLVADDAPDTLSEPQKRIRQALVVIRAYANQADPMWVFDQVARELLNRIECENWALQYSQNHPSGSPENSPAAGD